MTPAHLSGLRLRPARPGDQRELVRLLEALERDARIESDDEPLASVRAWRRDGVFVLAAPHGRLHGFIHVGLRSYAEGAHHSPVAFVEEWYVERALRHRGQGRALMAAAEAWARAQGLSELASDTTASNLVSQMAHQRLGFQVAERLVSFIKPLRPSKARLRAPRRPKSKP